jgi:hypothetical protein
MTLISDFTIYRSHKKESQHFLDPIDKAEKKVSYWGAKEITIVYGYTPDFKNNKWVIVKKTYPLSQVIQVLNTGFSGLPDSTKNITSLKAAYNELLKAPNRKIARIINLVSDFFETLLNKLFCCRKSRS